MVIGITGKYCAGKNVAARILEARGFYIIDVDKLGHQALADNKEAIVRSFGAGVLDEKGNVSRAALGGIVFKDSSALHRLEGISHPPMIKEVKKIIRDKGRNQVGI
ncbi:MAG: dephospho-CoA kinase, partial [Spirochaetota bacterium]